MYWRVIPYQINDPAWNMAVDEAIFVSYLADKTPPTLRFYGWSPPTISVGYFQDVERELNLEQLRRKGYGLVRRNTGGRAVLHEYELTYSVVAGVKNDIPDNLIGSYLYISKALANALQGLGVRIELNQGVPRYAISGACFESPSWYELTVNGRKLVGSAQFRLKNSFLQHGSILLKFSATDLGSVLRIPSGSIQTFSKELQDKVISFEELGKYPDPSEIAMKIIDSFSVLYGITMQPGDLTSFEKKIARQLVKDKYANDEWNLKRGNTRQLRLNYAGEG